MHPPHHDSLNNRLFCVDAQARQMTSTSTTASCRVLALLVLLRDLRDLESCFVRVLVSHNSLPKQIYMFRFTRRWGLRTGREALSKLLGLVGVLQDEGVQVSRASDLELGLRGLGVLLDPGGCEIIC